MTALWPSLADRLATGSGNLAAAHAGPLDLACQLNPHTVRTPALELLSAELEHAIGTPRARLAVSISPQEGKTEMGRHAVIRALQRNPDTRVVFASYSLDLARTSGRVIRQRIDQYGSRAVDPATGRSLPDLLGIAVAVDHAAAADWSLLGRRGGVVCAGVNSGLTGRPVDLLVVDDPVKDQQQAQSPVIRRRLAEWWTAVAETRLAPDASIVVIQTRWDEQDLIGQLLAADAELDVPEWRVVNVPALADGVTFDALHRPVGQWLVSARGRTVQQWEAIRRHVGERVFASLYQGRPAPLEGGIFKAAWFDTHRVAQPPPGCLPPTVVVDPADNDGDGDEAGIIVATVDSATRRVYLLDDLSAPMTVARWARLALLTCVRWHAPALAYERSLSQLPARIREAWELCHQQATALAACSGDQGAALDRLSRLDDTAEARDQTVLALAEIAPDVDAVLATGPAGPRLVQITARGSKQVRMQLAAPLFETGRARMVGRHPALEHQLSTWQPGQDSPDRADAAVHAAMHLSGMSAPAAVSRPKARVPTRTAQSRMSR